MYIYSCDFFIIVPVVLKTRARLSYYYIFFSFSSLSFIMLITVTTDGEEIFNLEIDNQMAIEDLKALLEAEVKIYI